MAKKVKNNSASVTAPKTSGNTGVPSASQQLADFKKKTADVDLANLTPEQLAQLQLEEAIKESSNPNAGLQKLHNPLSIGGCLINLLILAILTIVIAVFITYFWVDKFNLGNILYDMLYKFKVIDLWNKIVDAVSGIFSPKNSISWFI